VRSPASSISPARGWRKRGQASRSGSSISRGSARFVRASTGHGPALHLTEELRPYANELRLRKGLNFSVRMGINSGEVIVGKIGDDLRMDYTAQGHMVGLASRMDSPSRARCI
jgi:class 3 adenylate cyclase